MPTSEADYAALVKNVRHGTIKPSSQPAHVVKARTSIYKSKWEENFASKLDWEKRNGLIKAWWYEPFSLWLPGKVRYKPDFMVQYVDQPVYPTQVCAPPKLEVIEVKGWSKNRRDGITRMKIAAALFPCFVWRMVWMKKGGGFDGEYV